MKLGVIGKTGQLGKALAARAPDATFWGREDLDLSQPLSTQSESLRNLSSVDIIILAAAYTDVDGAELDINGAMETCYHVNAASAIDLAYRCQNRNIPLVYISTDYVFNGERQTPYPPQHRTDPLNTYGSSKKSAEDGILKFGHTASIVRTSWLFDGTSKNFLTTMLSLKDKDDLHIVSDQIGRPTYAGHLADAVLKLARGLHDNPEKNAGIYHASSNGAPTSWHGFAEQIFKSIGGGPKLTPVTTKDYGAPAPRPKYSVLDNSAFEKRFDHVMPDWMDGLRAALNEAGYET